MRSLGFNIIYASVCSTYDHYQYKQLRSYPFQPLASSDSLYMHHLLFHPPIWLVIMMNRAPFRTKFNKITRWDLSITLHIFYTIAQYIDLASLPLDYAKTWLPEEIIGHWSLVLYNKWWRYDCSFRIWCQWTKPGDS